MLQAMNTGHERLDDDDPRQLARDAISRLEQMLGMTGMPMTVQSILAARSPARSTSSCSLRGFPTASAR